MSPRRAFQLFIFLLLFTLVESVTIYGISGAIQPTATTGTPSSAATSASSSYTPPAFNTVVLEPPPIPSPPPPVQFGIQLQSSSQSISGLSIPHDGAFFGFSIEMSVVIQVVGKNSSYLQVPFLNLMSIMRDRAGRVNIRVGGNTQETAVLVDSLPDGAMIEKDKADTSNPTQTPTLIFTPEFIYLFSNVSSLVNTKWYLGIPMNDTSALRLGIAEVAEAILGDNLIGFQLGNEPDLYAGHGHRSLSYGPEDYFGEFAVVVQAIANDSNIPIRNNLIAPSPSGTHWSPEMVWDTGFITAYQPQLGALSVEHYPMDNCAEAFPDSGFGPIINPQDVFASYLTHASGINIVQPYLNTANIAQQVGKPFLMFETNTASCGGFAGLSDSFGAALWALDYGLQMAYSNFSGALLHVGGESDTYNPFTPPPTNQSTTKQWTVGPVFYAAVAVAETLGKSNTSQILDIQANGNNMYTPGYAVYDGGNLDRVALFNYMTDPSGANDYTASISVTGGDTPAQVSVKYLLALSVSEKFNITWAGQTLGGQFESDGRFQGSESVSTVPCDQTAGTCNINVPAPGFALVFLNSNALSDSEPSATNTFPTTVATKPGHQTFSVDPAALATSNGHSGSDRQNHTAGTSKGSSDARKQADVLPRMAGLLVAMLTGSIILLGTIHR